MSALDRFFARIAKSKSLLCVGLDPDPQSMPAEFREKREPLYAFNKMIISATHRYVCAYKPNAAFYEAYGVDGIKQLKKTCDFLHKFYPDIPIILDAKRGDIDSTNNGYVSYLFDYLGADATTLHPYLGKQALMPFLSRKDKVCIILCRTSNPGAGEFQDLKDHSDEPLYLRVAHVVSEEWNANKNCMLVTGATYPEELKKIRNVVHDIPLLVPGIGAQGGDLEHVLHAGLDQKKSGLLIAISRAIMYAGDKKAIAQKTREYCRAIERVRRSK